MQIITQDILEVESGIIGHQVNCLGVMGAGLALKIRELYPSAFLEYKRLCQQKSLSDLLGCVQPIQVNQSLIVCNLFGQERYGRGRQTNYDALKAIAQSIKTKALEPIYLPYGMGCGLGGGNWEVVQLTFQDTHGYWCRREGDRLAGDLLCDSSGERPGKNSMPRFVDTTALGDGFGSNQTFIGMG